MATKTRSKGTRSQWTRQLKKRKMSRKGNGKSRVLSKYRKRTLKGGLLDAKNYLPNMSKLKNSIPNVPRTTLPFLNSKDSEHRKKFKGHLLYLIEYCIKKLKDDIKNKEIRDILLINPEPENNDAAAPAAAANKIKITNKECLSEIDFNENKSDNLKRFYKDFLIGELNELPNEIVRRLPQIRSDDTQKKLAEFERKITEKNIKSYEEEKNVKQNPTSTGGGGDDVDIILSLLAELWRHLLDPEPKKGRRDMITNKASDYINKRFKIPQEIQSIARNWCKDKFVGINDTDSTDNVEVYIASMWLKFHDKDKKIIKLKKCNTLIEYDEKEFLPAEAEVNIASEFRKEVEAS